MGRERKQGTICRGGGLAERCGKGGPKEMMGGGIPLVIN